MLWRVYLNDNVLWVHNCPFLSIFSWFTLNHPSALPLRFDPVNWALKCHSDIILHPNSQPNTKVQNIGNPQPVENGHISIKFLPPWPQCGQKANSARWQQKPLLFTHFAKTLNHVFKLEKPTHFFIPPTGNGHHQSDIGPDRVPVVPAFATCSPPFAIIIIMIVPFVTVKNRNCGDLVLRFCHGHLSTFRLGFIYISPKTICPNSKRPKRIFLRKVLWRIMEPWFLHLLW